MIRYFLLLTTIFICSLSIGAQNSTKVKELERQRKAALDEIENTQAMLSTTEKNRKGVLSTINLLSSQIKNRNKLIKVLEEEVDGIVIEINQLATTIHHLEQELKEKKNNYAKALAQMHRKRNVQDKLLFILAADNFSQSMRRIRYLKEYSNWQKLRAEEIRIKQEGIEEKKAQLQASKLEKDVLLKSRTDEQKRLSREEANRKREFAAIKSRERSLLSQLDKKRKQARALNQAIEKQIALEIERAAEEARIRAAAEEAKRKKEEEEAKKKAAENATPEKKASKKNETAAKPAPKPVVKSNKYQMTAVERKLSGSFEKNKGNLLYPITGRSTVIGNFGEQQHRNLTYVRTNNNGIDLQGEKGALARACFEGTVSKVFFIPGYNSSVIIRHGNYLTVYANLVEIAVEAGDKVKTGEPLGKVYSDPEEGNQTILHFQVWKEKTKLNPKSWIRR